MSHTASDIVRWLLIDQGLGTDPEDSAAWPVYDAREPDQPDNCLTVYTTEGLDHGRLMPTGESAGLLGIQVRIRSRDERTGAAKAGAIKKAFEEDVYDETVTVDATSYVVCCMARIGDVLTLGDESPTSRRKVHTVNAMVSIRE